MKVVHNPFEAGECLKRGGIVLFPTETVYGIGASAYNLEACMRIYAIKGRPKDNPLILHLAYIEQIPEIAYVSETQVALLQRYMPGPTTFIFRKKEQKLYSSGLPTIGVRVPSLPIAHAMLAAAEIPIAAPSANLSGFPSITRTDLAIELFKDKVDIILAGPDSLHGLESTVVDLSHDIPYFVRPGVVPFEQLAQDIPGLEKRLGSGEAAPISPGQKYRHYAPHAKVLLLPDLETVPKKNVGQIGFRPIKKTSLSVQIHSNEEYMQKLYAFLNDCDRMNLETAYCELPQKDSLEETLLHRLRKAANLD